MKLSHLVKPWVTSKLLAKINQQDVEVHGLQNDSRRIKPGDGFVAYPGALTDGRHYIHQAIAAGAVAVIYAAEDGYVTDPSLSTVPQIPIPDLANQLAALASHFYHNPSQRLSVTGVTGTNGKTTVAYLLAQAYEHLKLPAVYLGTLGHGKLSALQPMVNTTPDALNLQQLMHQYKRDGIQQVCMEVSSHALRMQRVENIAFTQAIFTNLTHDHLDYHGTMEAYAAAKAQLFATPTLDYAILNQDDRYNQLMQQQLLTRTRLITYGLNEGCQVRALSWQIDKSGSTVEVVSPWGRFRLRLRALGRFNLYNNLAVFASLMASECNSAMEVCDVMAQLTPAPGRMEIVAERPCVIVDYAHTPDALENVLSTLVGLKQNKLWVVFGCGGDRDRSKRSMMGRIASQYADYVLLTNDNPRREEPAQIINDILQGVPAGTEVMTVLDRKLAIQQAILEADPQDIILIAGKGHENYQIIGDQRLDFSDQDIVRRLDSK